MPSLVHGGSGLVVLLLGRAVAAAILLGLGRMGQVAVLPTFELGAWILLTWIVLAAWVIVRLALRWCVVHPLAVLAIATVWCAPVAWVLGTLDGAQMQAQRGCLRTSWALLLAGFEIVQGRLRAVGLASRCGDRA